MNICDLSDKQCREMIKAKRICELEICEGDYHRPLTGDDTEKFVV